MNTDDLIRDLSRDPPPNPRFSPSTVVLLAAAAALVFALAISIFWLTPRPDLAAMLAADNHLLFLKLAFALGIAAVALPIVRDLSVPGRKLGGWFFLPAIPFFVMIVLALHETLSRRPTTVPHHDHIGSWLECLWQIPALSIPAFLILLVVARSLAPTNLRLIGASIGLAAGGIGAVGYAFHCSDDSMAFIAVFYSLAIFEMSLLGALLGPHVLKWTIRRR